MIIKYTKIHIDNPDILFLSSSILSNFLSFPTQVLLTTQHITKCKQKFLLQIRKTIYSTCY